MNIWQGIWYSGGKNGFLDHDVPTSKNTPRQERSVCQKGMNKSNKTYKSYPKDFK